jgi:hypothetical protein
MKFAGDRGLSPLDRDVAFERVEGGRVRQGGKGERRVRYI